MLGPERIRMTSFVLQAWARGLCPKPARPEPYPGFKCPRKPKDSSGSALLRSTPNRESLICLPYTRIEFAVYNRRGDTSSEISTPLVYGITCSFHCSSFLGIPFTILNIEFLHPKKQEPQWNYRYPIPAQGHQLLHSMFAFRVGEDCPSSEPSAAQATASGDSRV